MIRSAQECIAEEEKELAELQAEYDRICVGLDLAPVEKQALLLEATTAVLVHYHAEHFAGLSGDDDSDWTTGQQVTWCVVNTRREALSYVLNYLLDDASFDSNMDEWRQM